MSQTNDRTGFGRWICAIVATTSCAGASHACTTGKLAKAETMVKINKVYMALCRAEVSSTATSTSVRTLPMFPNGEECPLTNHLAGSLLMPGHKPEKEA